MSSRSTLSSDSSSSSNSKFEPNFEFELKLHFEFTFALKIQRKFISCHRKGQFGPPRQSFWTTFGAWERDTCENLGSPRPDPIWGGGTDPKSLIIAESSSPTRDPGTGCCTSYSPIPPKHLRWLTHQLQLDRAFGSSFRNNT